VTKSKIEKAGFWGVCGACGTEIQSEILGFGAFSALRAQYIGFDALRARFFLFFSSFSPLFSPFPLFFSSSFPLLVAVASPNKSRFFATF
jgi:hypothetical protein